MWSNPTNWDRLAVPDANSDVVITNTGDKHVVLNVDTTVASISVLGGANPAVLDLVGVNIHADGASLVDSNATIEVISNSTFSGSGSLQNSGTIKILPDFGTKSLALDCNFTNSGAIDIETNSTLTLTGTNTVLFTFTDGTTFPGPGVLQLPLVPLVCDGMMTLNGTIESQTYFGGHSTWTGPGLLRLQDGGMSGVTFAPDFHVELSGRQGINDSCTNQGSIRLIGTNDLVMYYGTFFNQGLFQIESNCSIDGMGGDFANSGAILVPANFGNQTLAIGCDYTNSGIIDVETNSTLELPDSGSALNTVFDNITFAGPGTVRFTGNNTGIGCFGTVTINGTVEFQRQTGLFGHSIWTGTGLFRWEAGGISGVTFAPDFHTEVSGASGFFGDSTNQGVMHLVGTNGWYVYGTFYNSGLFQIESNLDLQSDSFGGFENSGTILLPAELGTQTATLSCNFTNTGIIDVETNSTLNLTGFNAYVGVSFQNGTIFPGPGTVRFAGTEGTVGCNGVITVNGNIELQQPLTSMYGASTWTGPGLLRWQAGPLGGFTFAPDFHVEVSGPAVMYLDCTNEGSIRVLGSNSLFISVGTFQNSGLIQLETNFDLQGFSGSFENAGTIRVPAGLGTHVFTLDTCSFSNSGTIDVEAGSVLTLFATNTQPSDAVFSFLDGSSFAGGGTLQMLPQDGAIDCLGTMNVSNTIELNSQSIVYGPSRWTGPGLLRWLNGGIVGFTFAPDFHTEITGPGWKYLSMSCTNQGTLRWLGGGNLAGGYVSPEILYNEGLLQVEADGFWWDFALVNETSGSFRQLTGTLWADSFTNFGTARLDSGKWNVQRSFTCDPASAYQVSLSGTTPFTNFHQLDATNLALGGSLQVLLTNGYSPVDGDTFTIANNLAQSGSFSSVAFPALPPNLTWHIQYVTNAVVLAVAAAPAASGTGFTNGQFQFSFTGHAASAYDIQVSTNLTDWTTVETNSPFSGSVLFTDTNSPGLDHRYYRCRIFE